MSFNHDDDNYIIWMRTLSFRLKRFPCSYDDWNGELTKFFDVRMIYSIFLYDMLSFTHTHTHMQNNQFNLLNMTLAEPFSAKISFHYNVFPFYIFSHENSRWSSELLSHRTIKAFLRTKVENYCLIFESESKTCQKSYQMNCQEMNEDEEEVVSILQFSSFCECIICIIFVESRVYYREQNDSYIWAAYNFKFILNI